MAEGYKAWTGGQVLDAGDLTDYTSSQAVMRFANAAGRDAALTASIVREGMLAYLKDTNILTLNTDGSITGWIQIYPVITSGITDGNVTNAKLATNSVASANIINATIVGADIAAATITTSNIATGTTVSNALTLDGYDTSLLDDPSTIPVRKGGGEIESSFFLSTDSIGFYSDQIYTYIGDGCARVQNSGDVYSAVVSGRPVLISSALTLGTSSSSERFKEQIEPLAYDPADILKLNAITFRYKEDHLEAGADRPIEVGLIAEQMAALGFSEMVYWGDDGSPDGVAYDKVAVLLLKVCQDQQAQLDALSARLDKIGA